MEMELKSMEDTSVTISSSRVGETGKFADLGWISWGAWKLRGKSIQW